MGSLDRRYRTDNAEDSVAIADLVEREMDNSVRLNKIKKQDFKENLELNQQRLSSFLDVIKSVPESSRAALANSIFNAASDRENVVCNIYCDFAKTVMKGDLKRAFNSFEKTAEAFSQLFAAIHRNIDPMFENKEVTLQNAKVSHLTVFGIVTKGEVFTNYCVYMLDSVTLELAKHRTVYEAGKALPYKVKFLEDNFHNCAGMCKNMDNPRTMLVAIDNFQKSQDDVMLVDNNGAVNRGFIHDERMPGVLQGFLGSVMFNPFRWIGEQWNLYKHMRYLKQAKEKEYLEAHVALLELEMAGEDPNSDEYQKHVKTIENYNEMIAKIDRKIDAYLGTTTDPTN